MQSVIKNQQWYRTVAERTNNFQPALLSGLVLVVVVGGLAGLNPFLGIACALILLLLVLVAPRPILIVYGLAFLLPLLGGFARGVGVPSLRLGQTVLLIGFLLFVLARPGPQGKSRLTAMDLAFLLYFLAEAVFPVLALLYRGEYLDLNSTNNIYGVSALQTLLSPIQYYLLYRIVVGTISSEKQILAMLKLSFISSIVVSIIGILQKLGVAPLKAFLNTYYPSVTLHAVPDINQRITSTLGNYNGLAAYLTFTIIAALTCYTVPSRLKISQLLLAATLLFDSTALVLTGSFAALIGLGIGTVVAFLLIRRLPKLVIFILVGIVLAALIFQPFISARLNEQLGAGAIQGLLPQSFAFRIMLWQEIFLPAIGQHLFFGAGPAPAVLNNWSTEESEYLGLLLRGGLLYFFSYLLLIGVAIGACWQQIKGKNESAKRVVAITTLAILVAINIMNVSNGYFGYVGGTQTLLILLATVVASGQLDVLNSLTVIRRAVNLPFHRSPGITTATALDGSTAANDLTRGKNAMPSNSANLGSVEPMSKLDGHRKQPARLVRLLDWHFVKASAVVGVGSTMARVLGLLFATLLAHFLKPDNFGFYQYSITLVGIIGVAATASSVSVTRFLATYANDQSTRNGYFSNGLFGIALLLAIMLLISVPILWLLHVLNIAMIICIFCLTAFYGYLAVARGLGSMWKMGLTYLLSNVALVIALVVVFGIFQIHTVTAAVAIFGLTDLVPIMVLEFIKPMELRFRPGLISRVKLLELAQFAAPIVLATGAYTVWLGIDMLLVENLYPHAAGSYAVAKTLAGAFLFVPSAITMVLMPRVAALGSNRGKRYTIGAVLATLLFSLIGLVIVGVWGKTLIGVIFGHRYSDAYVPLLVLSIGMSIYAIYAILESFIIGRGRPGSTAQALFVALVSTSVTGFWLTIRLGTLGASLSFTIGAALGTMVMLFNTWRFLHSEKQVVNSSLSSAS